MKKGYKETAHCMQEMLKLRGLKGAGIVLNSDNAGIVFGNTADVYELGETVAKTFGTIITQSFKKDNDEDVMDFIEGWMSVTTDLKGRALHRAASKYYSELVKEFGQRKC